MRRLGMAGKTGVFASLPIPATAAPEPEPSEVEQQMLAEIRERPDDDGPRLVYADLLTLRDDPRGEFITAGVNGNQQRVSGLWTLHHEAWMKKLPKWAEYPELDRGFVSSIQLDGDLNDLVANERWREVLALAPIPAVKLRSRERGTRGQCIDVYFRHDAVVAAVLECGSEQTEHRVSVVDLPSWKMRAQRRHGVATPWEFGIDPTGDAARVRFTGNRLTYQLVKGRSSQRALTRPYEIAFLLDQVI